MTDNGETTPEPTDDMRMLRITRMVVLLVLCALGRIGEVSGARKPGSAYKRHLDLTVSLQVQRRNEEHLKRMSRLGQAPCQQEDVSCSSQGDNFVPKAPKHGTERLADAYIHFNRHPSRHVKQEMTVDEFLYIQQVMFAVVQYDDCSTSELATGRYNCVSMFREFRKIPKMFRGPCANVYMANCHKWRLAEGRKKICSFFIKTSPGESLPVEGQWQSLRVCAEGLPQPGTPNQLVHFLDDMEMD